jgi:hypothetical protein
MTTSKRIQTVLDLLDKLDAELVSYGLAPNPNGFCYEISDYRNIIPEDEFKLNEALEDLTIKEEQELRKLVF